MQIIDFSYNRSKRKSWKYSIFVISFVLMAYYLDFCTSFSWRRWRRLCRGWVILPTGMSIYTVLQWRRITKETTLPENTNRFHVTCYRVIPLRALSRAWGWICDRHVPLSMRCWLYGQYARKFGVNVDEAAFELQHYNTFSEFFIRQLKDGVRPIAYHKSIVSPADGSVISAGRVTSCNVEQIKGVTYTIKTFLGDPSWPSGGKKMISNNETTGGFYNDFHLSKSFYRTNKSLCSEYLYKLPEKSVIARRGYNKNYLGLVFSPVVSSEKDLIVVEKNKWKLGWLFYFHFYIKDIIAKSFYFGFQLVYISGTNIINSANFIKSHLIVRAATNNNNNNNDDDVKSDEDDDDEEEEEEGPLCDPDWEQYRENLLHNKKNELYQLVVYLAPGDYHRFHSPTDWKVQFRRHFQGDLLSVHPKVTKWIPELFTLNERVVYVGEWKYGFFSMIPVGATNVGSICVHDDEELQTNTRRWKKNLPRFKDQEMNVDWKKGEEIGGFKLGSTIVLLFEAPKDFEFSVQPGGKIKVGQAITDFPDFV